MQFREYATLLGLTLALAICSPANLKHHLHTHYLLNFLLILPPTYKGNKEKWAHTKYKGKKSISISWIVKTYVFFVVVSINLAGVVVVVFLFPVSNGTWAWCFCFVIVVFVIFCWCFAAVVFLFLKQCFRWARTWWSSTRPWWWALGLVRLVQSYIVFSGNCKDLVWSVELHTYP